ncbi:hypothetical protein VKT23_018404 [Stygiomarasmius scandens]|uniref:Uncharacterized protein n=1 Tax=Marasmiellus scandens TaxID=2682957 RepID=A0ABR1IS40_9AGAR
MMLFSKLTAFAALFASASVSSYATPVEQRAALDVFVPQITSPVAGDVWVVGEKKNVTWDVSDPPTQITNSKGTLFLRKGNLTTTDVLAAGFDILDKRVLKEIQQYPDLERQLTHNRLRPEKEFFSFLPARFHSCVVITGALIQKSDI